jgi:hypothetical protein
MRSSVFSERIPPHKLGNGVVFSVEIAFERVRKREVGFIPLPLSSLFLELFAFKKVNF